MPVKRFAPVNLNKDKGVVNEKRPENFAGFGTCCRATDAC